MGGATLGLLTNGFDDAAIEALDQTVGLRSIWSSQAMIDFVVGADLIEWMPSGGTIMRLILHIDGEAVGELAAVVGQDGVNAVWEVGQEPIEKPAAVSPSRLG